MSKERARKRAAREREAGIKAAARGAEQERSERQRSRKPGARSTPRLATSGGRRPSRQSARRSPASRRGHPPVGRADGPLARRRRVRTRLLVVLLVLANVAAWFVWTDWAARLAVLIVSVIAAPLLAALLLRRR